jgi:hypothetical protein
MDNAIFTPGNEPYLGRKSLKAFDDLIIACLAANNESAPKSHQIDKSEFQEAACQLIPQSISLALSIRELVRQGYLFGALTLIRPLCERGVTLMYLRKNPDEIRIWNRGWKHNEAPSLSRMLNNLGKDQFPEIGPEITRPFNSLIHGKPDSAKWSLVSLGNGQFGHGVSKILDNPQLCDQICIDAAVWLSSVVVIMLESFAEPR